jgi:hypothetical protein
LPNADRRLASNWLTRSDVDLSAVSGLMRTITDDYGAEFAVHSERVGNAYRVTDKVNIPDLQKKLQRP